MPTLYVYSIDDFDGGLPDEASAEAAGAGPFTLTLKPGATPTRIEIDDDETSFNELDWTQSLTTQITLDGATYDAGTTIQSAYDLIDTGTGHKVTTIHFGGSGFQQGEVDGLVSTEPLLGGESYTFDVERTSWRQNNLYEDYVPCFTPGCLIAIDKGHQRAVETLAPGDLIMTADHGPQPLRTVLQRDVSGKGKLAPVHVPAGIVGNRRPLLVSPQHRFLLRAPQLEVLLGLRAAFVPALYFVQAGLAERRPSDRVSYLHLILDRHEILFAEGAETESFLPSGVTALPPALRRETEALFPDLAHRRSAPCRPVLRKWEAMAALEAA